MNKNYLNHKFKFVFSFDNYSDHICEKCNIMITYHSTSGSYFFYTKEMYDNYKSLPLKLPNMTCNECIIKNIIE